jgi:outer membrane lipase/esterase
MVFFGDSGTDNGIYKPTVDVVRNNRLLLDAFNKRYGALPPLATGIPTTTPGLMWSEALGQKFGVAVKPASAAFADYASTVLAKDLRIDASALAGIGSAGNNYAASGAGVVWNAFSAPFAWLGKDQVAAYLASTGNLADPNALYVVRIGANDFASSGPNFTNLVKENSTELQTLSKGASDLAVTLKNAGARYILVPNIANFNSTDAVRLAVKGDVPTELLGAPPMPLTAGMSGPIWLRAM